MDMNLKEQFLSQVAERAYLQTPLCDHLITMFNEALSAKPKLIVELGVAFGESNFVLERVARLYGAKLISVDIQDCSRVSKYEDWIFVQKNDLTFALEFADWGEQHGIEPRIDVLFIDTSHFFTHSVLEIYYWFPWLSEKAKVFFHDTNLNETFLRKDGSVGIGWNNDRGVIRALEIYFGKTFDETADFTDRVNGWLIKHHAICNGFTILERGVINEREHS